MFGELSASAMMGAWAGLDFRKVGLPGMPAGNSPRAALMAACTSRAASSIFRSRENSSVTLVAPWRLSE